MPKHYTTRETAEILDTDEWIDVAGIVNIELATIKDKSELFKIKKISVPVCDGWDNKIFITVEDEKVTLISCGSDKERGGIGEAADIEAEFQLLTEKRRWMPVDSAWLRAPAVVAR